MPRAAKTTFEEKHAALLAEQAQGSDPEDPDEYRACDIFWVPHEARWSHLKAQARHPTIGQLVDDAMAGIERDNPALASVLPEHVDPCRGPLPPSCSGSSNWHLLRPTDHQRQHALKTHRIDIS